MNKELPNLRSTIIFGLGTAAISFAVACGQVSEKSLGIEFTETPKVQALTPEEFLAFHREERLVFTGEYPLDLCLRWPVIGPITSYFGEERGRGSKHTGLDIMVDEETPVVAAQDGEVEKIGWENYTLGRYIVIDHGEGVETLYAHLQSDVYVDGEEEVKRGQVIGAVGSTGFSTRAHLHFELRTRSFYLDPMNYFEDTPGQCKVEE